MADQHEVRPRLVDDLAVLVHPDAGALGRAAGDQAARALRDAVEARGEARAMFATGNSQFTFVAALIDATPDLPWDRTTVFHMDEYVGVGPDHPAGFQRWIRERIAAPARPGAVHYLDGLADPETESRRYAALLDDGPMDLCCLGVGENGHLAFNDPGVADFDDPLAVKIVTLEPACRRQQVDEGHFADIDAVPARAMTVTIPALLRASTVLAIVPEARKAAAVRAALTGPIATTCPASVLRRHAQVTMHLDPASAGALDWS
jgi:glucosamine-6-phosphate deaminase